jgi:quinol monooxygenase YgiN
MLIIAGRIEIDLQHREHLVAAAVEMMAASRQEAGCREYAITAGLAEPNVFHIFEKWDDQAALDAHFREPHMATFQAAIKGRVKGMDIHKYEAREAEGPLVS